MFLKNHPPLYAFVPQGMCGPKELCMRTQAHAYIIAKRGTVDRNLLIGSTGFTPDLTK